MRKQKTNIETLYRKYPNTVLQIVKIMKSKFLDRELSWLGRDEGGIMTKDRVVS